MKLLKQYQLKTYLDKSLVFEKLNNVTENWHKEDTKTQLFEGKIRGDNFKIYPTYDLAPRDHFRPEIEINLTQKKTHTQVNLKFSLPKRIKRFIPLAYIIYSIVQVLLVYVYFWTDFKIPFPFIFLPIALGLFVFIQTNILFKTRANKALGHLTKILDLQYEVKTVGNT